MAVRAGWDNGNTGVVDLTWCAQGINYAVQKGAIAVNCSWSNSSSAVLSSAVTNAIAKGVTVCVAAGNDNTQSQANNALSTRGDCVDVAAVDASDLRASFSNFGSWIDVAAAGDGVTSTYSNHYAPAYATGGGTSFSAPLTAGSVALFQGYRRSQGKPLYNAARMLLRLRDSTLRRIYLQRCLGALRQRPDGVLLRLYLLRCAVHFHLYHLARLLQARDRPLINTY